MQAVITILPNGCCVSGHCKTEFGYGVVKCGGRAVTLHRLMYEQAVGPIPPGMVLRHTCDTPACCNPNHLIPGTHAENVADRVARGRSAKGERNGRAKLTADDVLAIRADTRPPAVVAAEYGVDSALVRRIRQRKVWAWVPDAALSAAG